MVSRIGRKPFAALIMSSNRSQASISSLNVAIPSGENNHYSKYIVINAFLFLRMHENKIILFGLLLRAHKMLRIYHSCTCEIIIRAYHHIFALIALSA